MDIIIVTNDLHVCDLDKLVCMLYTKEKLLCTCTLLFFSTQLQSNCLKTLRYLSILDIEGKKKLKKLVIGKNKSL